MTVHRPHRRKRRRWEDLQPAGCEAKTEIHLKRGEVNPLPPQSRRGHLAVKGREWPKWNGYECSRHQRRKPPPRGLCRSCYHNHAHRDQRSTNHSRGHRFRFRRRRLRVGQQSARAWAISDTVTPITAASTPRSTRCGILAKSTPSRHATRSAGTPTYNTRVIVPMTGKWDSIVRWRKQRPYGSQKTARSLWSRRIFQPQQ